MPKKRFTSQYSKPPSTVHPSLNSGPSSNSSNQNDATPSVNELIRSLRRSQISSEQRGTSPIIAPTLPPQIRQLLSLPETPPPKARMRRRFDADGRRLPAGPAPPRSWLEGSSHAPSELRKRGGSRLYPRGVGHLPGLDGPSKRSYQNSFNGARERSLQDMCLRRMAMDWEIVKEWDRESLAYLPTGLRMLLLSNIAVYGPEDGIGFDGLKTVIISPDEDEDDQQPAEDNYEFYRLDLSGSVGRSVSFKQLTELVENPVQQSVAETEDLSWEDNLMTPITPKIPYLTHLSLSHPPSTISWPRLLQFSKYIPTLTHLSLAHWPVPSLTPNSTATVVSSKYGKDVQYGGTNYYSHSLDNDFREAASILRRLASTLYGLEYLDVSGCTEWVRALLWKGDGELGVEWANQWLKLKELDVRSGIELSVASQFWEVARYVIAVKEMSLVRLIMTKERKGLGKGGWIDITRDDFRSYDNLWKGASDDGESRKRRHLDSLGSWKSKEELFHETVLTDDDTTIARSVWDQ